MLKFHFTKKSFGLSRENALVYTFRCPKSWTKIMIRKKVKEIYQAEVSSVNTLQVQGKIKKFKGHEGKRADWKKAYVTLKSGQKLSLQGHPEGEQLQQVLDQYVSSSQNENKHDIQSQNQAGGISL
jgi:large subunit ribosomal protein L23